MNMPKKMASFSYGNQSIIKIKNNIIKQENNKPRISKEEEEEDFWGDCNQ
jgi:hypothetical protein